eukprot:382729_1
MGHNTDPPIPQDKYDGFVDIDIKTKLECILHKFDQLSLDESNDKSRWDTPNEYMDIKHILSQINEQYRFNILLSIHLLYENCKLSILLKSHLEPLVLLLSKISLSMGMHSYFDTYCRDCAHIIIPQLSKYAISKRLLSASNNDCDDKKMCPVPSIHDAILQCMRGNRKTLDAFPLPSANLLFDLSSVLSVKQTKNSSAAKQSQFYTGSAIFSPLLGPYSLLRKVCYFYDILSKKTQESNQTPRITSRYSLRNKDYNSNVCVTPLQINRTFVDHSYITPYTPSSIKRSWRGGIVSPCTPFTRHTSSRYNKKRDDAHDYDHNPPSRMSLDSSIRNVSHIHGEEREAYPFFSPSFLIKEETVYDASNRAEQLTLAMVEENFTPNDIDCLPLGIALPLREALRSCKYNPTHDWPKGAYVLIGREDLVNKGMTNMSEEDHKENDADERHTFTSPLNNASASSTRFMQRSMRSSATFVARDKYKYEFGPNKHKKDYSAKRYHVKKLLQQNIGPPSPKLCAINDINAMHKSSDNIRSATKTLQSLFMTTNHRNPIGCNMMNHENTLNSNHHFVAKPDPDGTLTVLDQSLLQFGSDYRLKEVRRILRSDKSRRIRNTNHMIGADNIGRNINTVPEYHMNLFHQIKRRMAQCVGRGMFTIWSYRPTATKPMDIPPLNLSGVVPSRNLKLDIDFGIIQNTVNTYLTNNNEEHMVNHRLSTFDDIIFQEYEEVDNELFLQWIEFHNGCSAGLRVVSHYDESRENVRTWICYNKPKTPSYSHAGFIFAQGLNGHLTCLMPADFYWYLGHKHEPTTMAIILGLSIARRGTMDTYVHKICCLHIASMVPGGFAELGIETTVQECALFMLFNGGYSNANNGANPSNSGNNENIEDRECYSLCAGIALGLIHLGLGGQGGEQYLNLENRLEQLMGGTGKRCKMLHYLYDIFNARTCASSNYTGCSEPISKYGITTGIPGGAGANSQSTMTGLSVFATSNIINPSIAAAHADQNKTNDKDHDALVSGKNHLRAAIHYFMPNFSDFPDINDDYNANDEELNGNSRIRDGQWVNTNMTAPGAILAFGLMYLKTNNKSAAKRLVIPTKPYLLDYIQPEWIFLKVLCKCIILWDGITAKESYFAKQIPSFISNNFPYHEQIKPIAPQMRNQKDRNYNKANMDYHAITLAYLNIITATCFALGLKYAGSHDVTASKMITHYLFEFLNCSRNKQMLNPLNVDRYTMETCLGLIALSLSFVQCGSGDLETLKIFRELRMCCDCDIAYGHHQMYGMCIGFLFLGGGTLTLGHSKLAIAALLISCYPRFAIHSLDNQFHLQILRHLYVLAIEKRHIRTIDIDTNLPIKVPIHIELVNDTIDKTTPCLLPDYNQICSIKIACPQFWDISLNRMQINYDGWRSIVDNDGCIYLKRKSHTKMKQYNNIVNVINKNETYNKKKQSDLIRAFGCDPNILEFAKQFCSPFSAMGQFCGYALYECLTNAKPQMMSTYIKLYHAMSTNKSSNYDIVWDIKLLNTYYENAFGRDWCASIQPLIQREFVAALQNKFETLYRRAFEENKMTQNLLLQYIKYGWNIQMNDDVHSLQTLRAFLSYSEMDKSFVIKSALLGLLRMAPFSTKNINYVTNTSNAKEKNEKKMFLLPLLNIAIKSKIKQINAKFGYNKNEQQQAQYTPSISAIQSSAFETPKQFNLNRKGQQNNRSSNNSNDSCSTVLTCAPKSFGLSVLTNVLTK